MLRLVIYFMIDWCLLQVAGWGRGHPPRCKLRGEAAARLQGHPAQAEGGGADTNYRLGRLRLLQLNAGGSFKVMIASVHPNLNPVDQQLLDSWIRIQDQTIQYPVLKLVVKYSIFNNNLQGEKEAGADESQRVKRV